MPVTNASSDDGAKTRIPIHSMSRPNAAVRAWSRAPAMRRPMTWSISPPPTQITAIETCTKSRSSYQVIPLLVARHLLEDPADDHVHEPDHDRRAHVRPEPVDRERPGDPLREREHEDVDREVGEPERDDHERE